MRHPSSSSSARSGRGVQAVQLRGPSTTAQTFLTALPGSAEELRAKACHLFHLPPSAPLRLTLADERVEICEDALPFLRDREVVVVHADLTSAAPPAPVVAPEAEPMTRTPPTSRARSLLDPLPRAGAGTTPTPPRPSSGASAWPAPPAERGPVATEAPGSIRYGQAGGRKRHAINTLERMAQQAAAEKAERAVIQAYAQSPPLSQGDPPHAGQSSSTQDGQPNTPDAPNAGTAPPPVTDASRGSLLDTSSENRPTLEEIPSAAKEGAGSAKEPRTNTHVPLQGAETEQDPALPVESAVTTPAQHEKQVPPMNDAALVAPAVDERGQTEEEGSTGARLLGNSTHVAQRPGEPVQAEKETPTPTPSPQQAKPERAEPSSSPLKDSQETAASAEAADSLSPSPLRKVQVPGGCGDAFSPSPQKRKMPPGKLLQATLLPGKRVRTEGPKNLVKAIVGPLRAHPCAAALACKDSAPWDAEYTSYLAQTGTEDKVVDLPSLLRSLEEGELFAASGTGTGPGSSPGLAELQTVLQRLLSIQEAFHLTGGRLDEAGKCRTLAQFAQMLITEHTPRRPALAVRRSLNSNPMSTPQQLSRRSLPLMVKQTPPSKKQANGELAFLSLMHQVRRDRTTADS